MTFRKSRLKSWRQYARGRRLIRPVTTLPYSRHIFVEAQLYLFFQPSLWFSLLGHWLWEAIWHVWEDRSVRIRLEKRHAQHSRWDGAPAQHFTLGVAFKLTRDANCGSKCSSGLLARGVLPCHLSYVYSPWIPTPRKATSGTMHLLPVMQPSTKQWL